MSWQDAPYITLSPVSEFSNERALTGVAGQIVLTDKGPGKALEIGLPQNVAKDSSVTFGELRLAAPLGIQYGGTGQSSFAVRGIVFADTPTNLKALTLTNGQIVIGRTGLIPVVGTLTGTTGEITVTNAAGSITLSLPALTISNVMTFADAIDIATNATTGTKIGTATTQKIGFWNAAPVAQGAAVADAGGGATVDAEARTALNTLLARIRLTGIIAT